MATSVEEAVKLFTGLEVAHEVSNLSLDCNVSVHAWLSRLRWFTYDSAEDNNEPPDLVVVPR
jgi:hypothetical protein